MEEHFYSFIKEELEDFSQFYSFTNNQYLYTVYFDVEEYSDVLKEFDFLHEKSYAFGFFNEKFNGERKKKDGKISITITKIVEDFIRNAGNETVLLFHCDTSDNKQACRHKLFNEWYKVSRLKEMVEMISLEVGIGEKTYYIGYICHKENPNLQRLSKEFTSLSLKLVEEK